MSGGHRFNKKFNSLEKRSLGGSIHPINNLRNKDNNRSVSSSPKESSITVQNRLKDIFEDPVSNSRSLRKSIENTLENGVVVESEHSENSDNGSVQGRRSRTVSGKHFFTMIGSVDDNLDELLVVRSMLLNGDLVQQGLAGDFVFRISADNDFLFFTKKERILVAISREHEFKRINFSINKRAILIELENNLGYVYLKYTEDDSNILTHFLRNKVWNVNTPTRVVNDLLLEKIQMIKNKRAEHLNKKSEAKASRVHDSLPTISPDKMYGRTRSSSRISERSPLISGSPQKTISESDSDIVKPSLVPKLFETELKYLFSDNKVFTITYSDFKTLYDNDWINDSLIDFFIKYEMDKAIYQKHLFKPSDVYAFNSFFFTKLMSGNDLDGPIDYYHNIRRWLNKLDLMSYPNIIIPINENLHWYCCLIKGLPRLLKDSLIKKKAELSDSLDLANDETVDVAANEGDEDDTFCSVSSSSSQQSDSVTPPKKSYQPEIFIFDSLRQKHTNIHFPLKKFIIDYCKERYDVNIEKNDIRMHSAKVPKQNNFNDCGIHVIYNVRKWLNNSEECERIWRSSQLRSASRLLFIAEERNGMRRELRNILLSLKKKQLMEHTDKPKDIKSGNLDDDDDIEVIEYNPVVATRNDKATESSKESLVNLDSTSSISNTRPQFDEQTDAIVPRTLDPKVKDLMKTEGNSSSPGEVLVSSHIKKLKIKNKKLRELLSDSDASITFQEVLNDYFLKNENINDFQLQRVYQLKDEINELDDVKDRSLLRNYIKKFINDLEEIRKSDQDREMRPKDEDFIIMHCSDNEELNRSVNGLTLSNTSYIKSSSTPGTKDRSEPVSNILELSSPIQTNIESVLNVKSPPSKKFDIAIENDSTSNRDVVQKSPDALHLADPLTKERSSISPSDSTTDFSTCEFTLKRRKLDINKTR